MCKHFYFIFQRTVFQQPVYTAKKVGVKVERITIKHLKNRWGSMTKQGSINLNVNLLKAPEDVIDYIIYA
jgi:predicted metal-dependent hydrolase